MAEQQTNHMQHPGNAEDADHGHAGHAHAGHDHAGHAHAGRAGQDPVCGMVVDPAAGGPAFEHDGQVFYFCSEHCRAKFAADPAAYLNPAGAPAAERAADAAAGGPV